MEQEQQLHPLAGERSQGESDAAVVACNDYLRLGLYRARDGLRRLQARYTAMYHETPPTRSHDTLKQWSSRFAWSDRAELYEQDRQADADVIRAAVLADGLAQDYERVELLKKLAAYLVGEVLRRDESGEHRRVWLRDVKQIGSGDGAERVDVERFNAELIGQLRGVLDDLAKETGGRKQRVEHGGDEQGTPIRIVEVVMGDGGTL